MSQCGLWECACDCKRTFSYCGSGMRWWHWVAVIIWLWLSGCFAPSSPTLSQYWQRLVMGYKRRWCVFAKDSILPSPAGLTATLRHILQCLVGDAEWKKEIVDFTQRCSFFMKWTDYEVLWLDIVLMLIYRGQKVFPKTRTSCLSVQKVCTSVWCCIRHCS